MDQATCDSCGKVYNPYLGQRFWSGCWTIAGEVFETLCDNCHRELVRTRD